MNFHSGLRVELIGAGAAVVGFACVKEVTSGDISHLERAISIGVVKNLNERTVRLLVALEKRAARRLRERGYRYLCIPPDSDRANGTFISKLYPLITHKMAATLSGLGWIGRNGLLINPVYGPRLSFATVLTDAPLQTGTPVTGSKCGGCTLCMDFCPSHAITGNEWSQGVPYADLVRTKKCSSWKEGIRATSGKPNCGLCINICPYGRNAASALKDRIH
ncbi:MAG: 4Fe-4S dicluster domain-containing protein [Nitrospiraceae bacterium]|nr:4Fe-4S dicluster domain-containing protein [Nitrospiraceae bacterium]